MNPHPDAAAFLNAITSCPEDDVPRLVYADWLQEQGDDARAEFIRVQIERSQLPEWDVRQVELRLREEALVRRHGHAWREELPHFDGIIWDDRFERGFVVAATIHDLGALLRHHTDLVAATPIRDLTLDADWGPHSDMIPALPWLRRLDIGRNASVFDQARLAEGIRVMPILPLIGEHLEELGVSGEDLLDEGLDALSALSKPGRLSRLRILGHGDPEDYADFISTSAWERFARSDLFSQVTELDLDGLDIELEGLEALLFSTQNANLKTLRLSGGTLSSDDLVEFAAADTGMRLDQLHLSHVSLFGDALHALSESSALSALKILRISTAEAPDWTGFSEEACFKDTLCELDLSGSQFNTQFVTETTTQSFPNLHTLRLARTDLRNAADLAAWLFLKNLKCLDLSDCSLGSKGLKALLTESHCPSLVSLDLSRTEIGPDAIAALAESSMMGTLRELRLNGNVFGNAGLYQLADALPRLWVLGLGGVGRDITAGLRALLARSELDELVELSLESNELTSEDMELLATCEGLTSLARLDLGFNPIQDAGLTSLVESLFLRGLVSLDLTSCCLNDDGMTRFLERLDQGALPNLRECHFGSNPISEEVRQRLVERCGEPPPIGEGADDEIPF